MIFSRNKDKETPALTAEFSVEFEEVASNVPANMTAMLTIKAPEMIQTNQPKRKPLDIVCVIDRSGR